jgi:DNA polymerase-3 subunit alpha
MTTTIRPAADVTAGSGPARFVHLKVHSAYSLLEGALQISRLATLAAADAMPAVGLTDTNNMFGVLEFSEKLATAGVQPIVGCTLQTDFVDAQHTSNLSRANAQQPACKPAGSLALLARNEEGYANLMKLASACFLKPRDLEPPHIKIDDLEQYRSGLIVLTGGPAGPIDSAIRSSQPEMAHARLQRLQRLLGRSLYVEIQRHGLKHEQEVERSLLQLAYSLGIPIVASNECYFESRDDYDAHDALLCIADGTYVAEQERRRCTPEHYFKSQAEMAELFCDLPEALENTLEIAKRCAFRPKGRKPILPRFVAGASGLSEAEQLTAEAAELRKQASAGLAERLAVNALAPGYVADDYRKRLDYELDVIERMKFPGYFLIVADFIKWAKANGIPVGPGRGSGAGSVVAWSLTITDLDPLRFGLLFERFLNPERISMPDFDIDFCQERRDEVIRYVQRRYGADRVAQIITHGKLQARAVLRDVGRVLQIPYGQVDKLCKLVPNNPTNPVTLPQAVESEPKLQEARDGDPTIARLLEIAQKLEGLYRHASTHAAGMVIGDRPLDELVPLYRDPRSSFPITQFNWKLVEAAGLVKFDFLGLKTLTVLQKAVEIIKRGRGIEIDLARVPLDDKKTYEVLARADAVGVFQMEGTGMRESLKRLRPDRIEDLIAMVALYRPGPMDNIPTYINRKHGEEPVDCLHPLLEPILKETYGVIVYQEQVMQIAQVLAGYSLGEADLLRRAMGKKDRHEMARQQSRFLEGALKKGVQRDRASHIFELIEKFSGYGFNKCHSAPYALISYYTAYLKANFREEFLAASMTLDMDNTDKLAMFVSEAKKSGITILPPCINASEVDFLAGEKSIRYSLAALKNIGAQAVESVVADRTASGPYKSLTDFAARCNTKALNKRAFETLCSAGAFDVLEPNRALAHANVEAMLAFANRLASDAAQGTSDLFGSGETHATLDVRPAKPWNPIERLQQEFQAVGFFLSGHPLDAYAEVLAKLEIVTYSELESRGDRGAVAGRLAGVVVSARERRSQKGNKFAFAVFSEPTGQFEAVIFSETLVQSRHLLEPGTAVLVAVEGERDGDTFKLRVQTIESLDAISARVHKGVKVVLDGGALAGASNPIDELKLLLRPGGKGFVRLGIALGDTGRELEIALPGRFEISPAQKGAIRAVDGVLGVIDL